MLLIALRGSSLRPSGILTIAVALLLLATAPAAGKDRRLKKLSPEHRRWVEEVELLMTPEEREAFLELREDRHRDAFIEAFWRARDPDPRTRFNEYREQYYQRLEAAAERFPAKKDDRVPYYLIYGEPERVIATDCSDLTWPLESWRIFSREPIRAPLVLIFYQPNKVGGYRLWKPADGHNVLLLNPGAPTAPLLGQEQIFLDLLRYDCRGAYLGDLRELITDFGWLRGAGPLGPVGAGAPPPPRDPEWLATFQAASTQPASGAEPLEATLEFRFEADGGERVAVQGILAVPPAAARAEKLGAQSSYNFILNGEVLRDGEVFETFRYRYDFPAKESRGSPLSVVFERRLRPGVYLFVVALEDIHGGRVFHAERRVEVPETAPADEDR